MFNFKDLGDVTKLAQDAKQVQKRQEKYQDEMISLLREIFRDLREIKNLLQNRWVRFFTGIFLEQFLRKQEKEKEYGR